MTSSYQVFHVPKLLICNAMSSLADLVDEGRTSFPFFNFMQFSVKLCQTRMHSSRMRTARFSGCLYQGVSNSESRGCLVLGPWGCLPLGIWGVYHTSSPHTHLHSPFTPFTTPPLNTTLPFTTHTPVNRMNHRQV